MSLDLISSLDTRFFAEEINSQHIPFDLESSLGSDDNMLSLNEFSSDPMVPFHIPDAELMDAGVSSDSDSNSYSALLEFNLNSNTLNKGFAKFDPCDFPNLLGGVGDDIKLEPISPLAQSPQPLSPFGNVTSSFLDVKSELQQMLDTPPISPPHQSNTSLVSPPANNEIIKVFTINSDGNFHVSNDTKLVLGKNGLTNISQPASNLRGTNIQPKPTSGSPVVIKLLPHGSSIPKQNLSGQPLVLTAEEFANLTQQTAGKSTTEAGSTTKLVQSIGRIQSPSNNYSKPILNTSCASPPSVVFDNDVKALKRQQRMIKNRESACLSRKKKKEYVSSLESTLSDLNRENQQLKQENIMLREKIALLEREREGANKSSGFAPNAKKSTAIFAVFLLLSFNMAHVGNLLLGKSELGSNTVDGTTAAEHLVVLQRGSGRTLLWTTDDNPFFESGSENASLPMCPMLINLTESSRIDSELRGWFHAPPSSKNPPTLNMHKPEVGHPLSKHELAKIVPRSSEMTSTAYRKYLLTQRNTVARNVHAQLISKNEIQVYEALPKRYHFAAFYEAIQRKDDTFYVVSFSDDHLLLPATEHNNTVRPRMSLLLPAMPLNQTMQPPPGHVAMMKIDCEVTNTQLLHIRQDTIPPLTSYGNRTDDRRPETGKRAWRKNSKKGQQKFENSNQGANKDSRG